MSRLPFQQLLKNNDLGIIENPLRRIDEEDLERYTRTFHEEGGLASVVDADTLIHGGRLARDEEAVLAENTLNTVDNAALAKEKVTSIWGESREIKIILLVCCEQASLPVVLAPFKLTMNCH